MIAEDLFRRGLRRLAFLLSEGRVSSDMVDAYRQSLSDLTDEDWTRAVLWAQQNCRHFPRPVELREAIGKPARPEADPPPGESPGVPTVLGVPLADYVDAARSGRELPEAAHRALLGDGGPPPLIQPTDIVAAAARRIRRMK